MFYGIVYVTYSATRLVNVTLNIMLNVYLFQSFPEGLLILFLAVFFLVTGCTKTDFQCDNGTCLPLQLLCNSITDCANWKDEGVQVCGKPTSSVSCLCSSLC